MLSDAQGPSSLPLWYCHGGLSSPGTQHIPQLLWLRGGGRQKQGGRRCVLPLPGDRLPFQSFPDSEPKPAGQQLKDSLLQQHSGSGDSSPKQIEVFKIKTEKKGNKKNKLFLTGLKRTLFFLVLPYLPWTGFPLSSWGAFAGSAQGSVPSSAGPQDSAPAENL